MKANLEYYRIFYYVARTRSFTKAAEALDSNQPNVTRAMNKLESELGCHLFVRSNKGLTLTEEGEYLYHLVQKPIIRLEEAEESLADLGSQEHGSVTISTSETALNVYLLNFLKKFREEHPDIRIRISSHATAGALRALMHENSDLALVTSPYTIDPALHTEEIMHFTELLVGGPAYKKFADQELTLDDLVNQTIVSMAPGSNTFYLYNSFFEAHGRRMIPDTEVASADQLLPMIRANMGVGFLPEAMARESLDLHEIYELKLKEPVPERSITLVTDPRHEQSAASRLLLRTMTGEKR